MGSMLRSNLQTSPTPSAELRVGHTSCSLPWLHPPPPSVSYLKVQEDVQCLGETQESKHPSKGQVSCVGEGAVEITGQQQQSPSANGAAQASPHRPPVAALVPAGDSQAPGSSLTQPERFKEGAGPGVNGVRHVGCPVATGNRITWSGGDTAPQSDGRPQ